MCERLEASGREVFPAQHGRHGASGDLCISSSSKRFSLSAQCWLKFSMKPSSHPRSHFLPQPQRAACSNSPLSPPGVARKPRPSLRIHVPKNILKAPRVLLGEQGRVTLPRGPPQLPFRCPAALPLRMAPQTCPVRTVGCCRVGPIPTAQEESNTSI